MLISFALMLSKVHEFLLMFNYIKIFKLPNGKFFWPYWYFPIIIMCSIFPFRYSVCFILIYLFLFSFIYSWDKFSQLTAANEVMKWTGEKRKLSILKTETLGTFIPVLSFLFLSIFLNFGKNQTKNNNTKIFSVFALIILIQTMGTFLNGISFWDFYKRSFEKMIKKDTFPDRLVYLYIFLNNLIPMIISNFFHFTLFSFIKPKILENYNNYLEN
ncbi:hypothetical protein [Candidatus Phytoplasma luffae]|nr:hypothetical protein [Candidatus Phytoplasma luffae]